MCGACSRAGRGARRPKLDRESFLNAFDHTGHRSAAVRLLGVADESGTIEEGYANGLGIRIPCSHWKKPVGVAWLFGRGRFFFGAEEPVAKFGPESREHPVLRYRLAR
jgi:hypothetical protein